MATLIDHSKLQTAVGQLLAADAELTTLLGDRNGRIQGHARSDIAMPYVTIGADRVTDNSVQGLAAKSIIMEMQIFTEENGFTLNKQIASRIVVMFDDVEFAVTDHRVVSCFFRRQRFYRDLMDGARRGVVEFDVELE